MTTKIDQAKLTAYALGELKGAEVQEIELLLKSDPDARRYVDEVRSLGKELEFELSEEPLPPKPGFSGQAFGRRLRRNWEWAVVACLVLIALAPIGRRIFGHRPAGVEQPAEEALSEPQSGTPNAAVIGLLDNLLRRPVSTAPVANCRFAVPRPGRYDERGGISDSVFEGLQSKTLEVKYQFANGSRVESLAVLLGAVTGSTFTADAKDIVRETGDYRLVMRRLSPQSSAVFAFLKTTAQYYCWASVKLEGTLDGTLLSEISGKIQALAEQIAASVAQP